MAGHEASNQTVRGPAERIDALEAKAKDHSS
jgi:hypothetical protein